MLKLKTTFCQADIEIDDHIRKIIIKKFIAQIAQCVLNDIAQNSEQAGMTGIKNEEL